MGVTVTATTGRNPAILENFTRWLAKQGQHSRSRRPLPAMQELLAF